MSDGKDHIPDLISRAVELALQGEHGAARSVLGSIDYEWLFSRRRAALRSRRTLLTREKVWQQPRQYEDTARRSTARIQCRTAVPAATRLAIFERDHFICRYSHCNRRTVFVPVLRALSALYPDVVPYQKNWRPLKEHILYWTYGTSLDHLISFPHGGTSDPKNLITTCYRCNDIKNMISASDLGWEVGKLQEEEDWDGLKSYLKPLGETANRIASQEGLIRPPNRRFS